MNVILFGAGVSGKMFLEKSQYNILAFADNDSKKQGTTIHGLPVISPDQIAEFNPDTIIITSMFVSEIKQQLEQLGFGDITAYCDNKDFNVFRDNSKILYFKDHEIEKNKPVLKTIHLNLTDACNLNCRICRPEDFRYKASFLDREVIERIVDDVFDELTHLRLDSSGELTLSPHLEYILEEATKRKIAVFVCTNGTRINSHYAELFAKSTVELIQVSLDSPEKQTLEWIRKGADFEEVLDGARNLVKARNAKGNNTPQIHFHGAIMKQNLYQLKGLVQLAHDMDIDGVTFAYCYIHSYMDPDWSIYWDQDICNQQVQEASALADKLGIYFNSPQAFNDPNQPSGESKYCRYLFEWSYIHPSGEVYPCCRSDGSYVPGNIYEDSIKDIWLNDKYQKLRETYNTENPVWDHCTNCYQIYGWDPADYKSHFHSNHWDYIEKRLSGQKYPQDKFGTIKLIG